MIVIRPEINDLISCLFTRHEGLKIEEVTFYSLCEVSKPRNVIGSFISQYFLRRLLTSAMLVGQSSTCISLASMALIVNI